MKTEFNLIPAGYARRVPLYRKILSCPGAAAAVLLCGVLFGAGAFYALPRLALEEAQARRERDGALERVRLLNGRCQQLRAEERFWADVLSAARTSAPAFEAAAALYRALPETASVESLSADGGVFRADVLFADTDAVNSFMRRLEDMPYGPVRVIDRRFVQQGALLFRIEAPRRR